MRVVRVLFFFVGACFLTISGIGWTRHAFVLPFLIWGSILIAVSLLERGRYQDRQSDTQTVVSPDEEDTNEVFSDPTTGSQMRVLYNRRTGERRYVERRPD